MTFHFAYGESVRSITLGMDHTKDGACYYTEGGSGNKRNYIEG